MDPEAFGQILTIIEPKIKKQDSVLKHCIPAEQRLTTTLRYLATGRTFVDLQFERFISPPQISRIIMETCNAIIDAMGDVIHLPTTEDEWRMVANDFESVWDFPNCLGALDGKHITIRKPSNSGEFYMNYKGRYSIVLMAMVNANCEFLFAHVGTNGRVSDSGVYSNIPFSRLLKNGELNIPTPRTVGQFEDTLPYVFIGDAGFALEESLITPYSRQTLTSEQMCYNERHSRGRQTIERTFAQIVSKFRALCNALLLCPEKASKIVLTICILHNFLKKNSPYYESNDSTEEETLLSIQGGCDMPSTSKSKANEIRQKFSNFFKLKKFNAGSLTSCMLYCYHFFLTACIRYLFTSILVGFICFSVSDNAS